MRDYLILLFLGLLFFVPFLGGVHLFDWDEINFAEAAREMILTGDYFRPQIDFEPFWEKPPLFIWFQAISMHVFGINEFAARLPNAICGIATLLLVFHIGKKIFSRSFAWLWALAWMGSLLPHFYFRSGIIDPWFNFFIFCGLYGFIQFRWQFFTCQTAENRPSFWKKYRALLIGGWFVGLAVLTKGPVGYLIPMLVILIYWGKYKFRGRGYVKHFALFTLAAASVSALWFSAEILMHGTWFVSEFITYQIRLLTTEDAGHGGFFGYHFVILLIGCFPASVFAIPNLWGDHESEAEMMDETNPLVGCERSDLTTWMQILFWVVLILFSLVKTKIVHYSSMAYFPLTFLAAVTIWRAMKFRQFFRSTTFVLPAVGTVLAAAILAVPYFGNHLEILKPLFSRDQFALENLKAGSVWCWIHYLPGVVLAISVAAGFYFWKKKNVWRSAEVLFSGGAIFTASALFFYVKNIENYSQNAAIQFYESKSNEDCFVRPVGFKSFAHLFYTKKRAVCGDKTVDDFQNLRFGQPGKKVYFVTKITNLGDLQNCADCRELYRKNGFVFFERISNGFSTQPVLNLEK